MFYSLEQRNFFVLDFHYLDHIIFETAQNFRESLMTQKDPEVARYRHCLIISNGQGTLMMICGAHVRLSQMRMLK